MSKDEKHDMGGSDSLYDLSEETFTLDKRVETFVSERYPSEYRYRSTSGEALTERLVGRRSSHDAPGPSFSSFETLTTKCSWIREEENCEEHASSFHDLDSYSPQLTTPTKIRAKRPGVHGREKRNSVSEGQPNTTDKRIGQETPGPLNKELTQDTHGDLPRKTNSTDDTSQGAPSSVCKKDNVSSLKDRFEQMSG